ncbi:MAG: 50S ribosomal protein L6 [Gemmatimonadales bacterium]|nr:MAG: 50S ribosomal protein L6 [Gemmatimonadales bacterium]
MSRIAKRPLPIPAGVTVQVGEGSVTVKGPKGELTQAIHPDIKVSVDGNAVTVTRPSDEPRHKALHGTTWALLRNMLEGVTQGYQRVLEIHGVGYKAELQQNAVRVSVGFSHPVTYQAPPGIKLSVEGATVIRVEGIDKALVGKVASEIRKIRPPEPFKGKGIRYQGERVRRKAGKTGAKA